MGSLNSRRRKFSFFAVENVARGHVEGANLLLKLDLKMKDESLQKEKCDLLYICQFYGERLEILSLTA